VNRRAYRAAAVSRRTELTAVFAGGCAGALARVALSEAWPADPGSWPWATLLVNVAGAFVLGLVVSGGPRGALLGPGFCGALTTFSTLQLEVLEMLDDGRVALAAAYLAVSVAAGLCAVEIAGRRG
jgi:CrcB protein